MYGVYIAVKNSKSNIDIWHQDWCSIFNLVVGLRNSIQISAASKSWTRMEYKMQVPYMPLGKIFRILDLKDEWFYQTNYLIKLNHWLIDWHFSFKCRQQTLVLYIAMVTLYKWGSIPICPYSTSLQSHHVNATRRIER